MRKILISSVILSTLGLANPGFAAEWINCYSADKSAHFNFLAGDTEWLSLVGVTMSVGKHAWTTDPAYGPGDKIVVSQGFMDFQHVDIDVMDENRDVVQAELRLTKAIEGDGNTVYGGTLKVHYEAAWPVVCDAPG